MVDDNFIWGQEGLCRHTVAIVAFYRFAIRKHPLLLAVLWLYFASRLFLG